MYLVRPPTAGYRSKFGSSLSLPKGPTPFGRSHAARMRSVDAGRVPRVATGHRGRRLRIYVRLYVTRTRGIPIRLVSLVPVATCDPNSHPNSTVWIQTRPYGTVVVGPLIALACGALLTTRYSSPLVAPPHCTLLEWMCLRAPNKLDHIPVDDYVVNRSVVRQVTF